MGGFGISLRVPRRVRQRLDSRFNPSPLSSLRMRIGSFGIVPGVQQIPVRSTNCNSGRLHPASFSPRSGRCTCPITVLPRQRCATSHPSRAGPAPGALAPLEPAPSLSTLDRSSWFPWQGRQLEMKVTSAKRRGRPRQRARPSKSDHAAYRPSPLAFAHRHLAAVCVKSTTKARGRIHPKCVGASGIGRGERTLS
jgi:hypothetical protein